MAKSSSFSSSPTFLPLALWITLGVFCFSISATVASCSSISAQSGFDIHKYLGQWYYLWHSPAPVAANDCSYSVYGMDDDGTITINKHFRRNGVSELKTGTAHPMAGNEGQMEVSFSPGIGTIKVIDTDYQTYSAVVACIRPRPGAAEIKMGWIFSKSKSGPSASTLTRLKSQLAGLGFHNLIQVNQSC